MRHPRTLTLLLAAALSLLAARAHAQLPAVIDLDVTPGLEAASVFRLYGSSDGSFGSSYDANVAFGDLNADGYDDLVVGTDAADPDGRANAGEVTIIFGNPGLAARQYDLAGLPGAVGDIRVWGAADGDRLGFAVACADFNGDGTDDLAMGAPQATTAAGIQSGEVVVLFGSPTFSTSFTTIDLADPAGTYGEARFLGDGNTQSLGWSLAAGDVNADGFADLAAGAIGAQRPARAVCGEAIILYGSSAWPNATTSLDVPVGSLGETRLVGGTSLENLGQAVALGDVNGDGFDDLLASSVNFTAPSPSRANAGQAVLLFGGSAIGGQELDLVAAAGTHGEVRFYGAAANDRLGRAVDLGDMDGDGMAEVVAGAEFGDFSSRTNCGTVYIVPGQPAWTPGVLDFSGAAGSLGEARIHGDNAGDSLGRSLALDDVNGDGFGDLVAGSLAESPGGNANGEIVVVFGAASLTAGHRDLASTPADVVIRPDDASDLFAHGCIGGGDLGRDGFADLAATAPLGANPNLGGVGLDAGYAIAVFGDGAAAGSATVVRRQRAGDGPLPGVVPAQDFGPVVRVVVDFPNADTADNGAGGASRTAATVTRSKASLVGPGPGPDTLDVMWYLETDRTGWADVELTFTWTADEQAGVSGAATDLAVFRAPAPTGPWTELATTIDGPRNTARVTTATLGYFSIANRFTLPVELSLFRLE